MACGAKKLLITISIITTFATDRYQQIYKEKSQPTPTLQTYQGRTQSLQKIVSPHDANTMMFQNRFMNWPE